MQDRICGLRQAKVEWVVMRNFRPTSLSKSNKNFKSTETLESSECINIHEMIRQSQYNSVEVVGMDEVDRVATVGEDISEFTNINDLLRAGGNNTGTFKHYDEVENSTRSKPVELICGPS